MSQREITAKFCRMPALRPHSRASPTLNWLFLMRLMGPMRQFVNPFLPILAR